MTFVCRIWVKVGKTLFLADIECLTPTPPPPLHIFSGQWICFKSHCHCQKHGNTLSVCVFSINGLKNDSSDIKQKQCRFAKRQKWNSSRITNLWTPSVNFGRKQNSKNLLPVVSIYRPSIKVLHINKPNNLQHSVFPQISVRGCCPTLILFGGDFSSIHRGVGGGEEGLALLPLHFCSVHKSKQHQNRWQVFLIQDLSIYM